MEEQKGNNNINKMSSNNGEMLWGTASIAQVGMGIRAIKKGYIGDGKLMPLKAFAIASLFVGALATSSIGVLKAFGINKVEDMKAVGASIRTGMGVPPRKQVE